MLTGIDVSKYQYEIDWQKAKDKGITFAFIRACYGTTPDPMFQRNWAEAKKAGIKRSAYGWVLVPANQINNAAYHWKLIKDDPGELPPAVDFEKFGTSVPGFSSLQLYMTELEKLCNRKPIMYTSKGYWMQFKEHPQQYWILNYPFWIAQWNNNPAPSLPKPFETWKFWQWSGDGNGLGHDYGVPKAGTSIDLDRFNGDELQFAQYLESGATTPTTPPAGSIEERLNKLEAWGVTMGYKP